MKIDLIHYSSPPVVGGVESVLAYHARMMAEAGHSVRIITGRGEIFDPGIPVIQLEQVGSRHPDVLAIKRELDQGRLPEQYELLKNRLAEEIKEIVYRTDILIAHNVCSLNKNLPLTAALHRIGQESEHPKLILWHHDLAWTTPRYRPELYDGLPWDLLRTDWTNATQVVISQARRRELCELLGVPDERVRVIPNGLDLKEFFKLDEQSVRFIQQLRLDTAAPLLLLPVRITPRKNIEQALRILAALKSRFPKGMLVVTGPQGPHNPENVRYFNRLVALRDQLNLNGSAHFLAEIVDGFLPYTVIVDFYRLADALLMPSREEGFGLPVLETGLEGLPIFCSDILALRELAGEHASYFDPDADPQEIARLIGNVLTESRLYSMRCQVRNHYTWERIYSEQIQPLLVERMATT
jgi:glycosyltransferase involved in cell wall biosynthesis